MRKRSEGKYKKYKEQIKDLLEENPKFTAAEIYDRIQLQEGGLVEVSEKSIRRYIIQAKEEFGIGDEDDG